MGYSGPRNHFIKYSLLELALVVNAFTKYKLTSDEHVILIFPCLFKLQSLGLVVLCVFSTLPVLKEIAKSDTLENILVQFH